MKSGSKTMTETDLQLGGGYTYQWECAILLALNYFFDPVRYNPTLFDLVKDFLGQVAEIHLEGEDRESGVDLEDINLVNGDRRILIQVKTKQAEGERWTPTDPLLLKVLYRFYDSSFIAEQPEETRFVFLTNRSFNRTLVRVKSAIGEGTLARCAEADKLCQHLDRYARKEKGESVDANRFREMLARTALVEYLAVDEVKANVQAKLQAHGRRDWEQAHALLFEHFARQSTRVGGGTVTRASVVEVLGPPTTALPPSPVTAALPPRPPDYFVGRREILDELKAGLVTGGAQAITALQGMGGIGKTATAQQLALEVEADFPGGVFWADLPRHSGASSSVLAAWAKLCGHDVASLVAPQARAQALRGMLGARRRDKGRLLVVLDDVREGWLEGAQTLKTALPPGVPLVLTTRDEELAHALGAEVRRLDALPMDDALALLSRLAGAEVVEAEPLEARALAERVGRLPLALELAGKLAARYARKPGWRLATLRAQVEARAAEALKLRGHPGLAATFAISYEALTEEQQRLFRWLDVFAPGPITVAAVAGVLGGEEEATEVILDNLVGLSLVEWGEVKGVYRLHPLLAEYARTLLEEAGEQRVARRAYLAYYLAYAKANAKRDPAAHDQLEAELANLMAAAEWAAAVGEHQAVGGLRAALYADSEFLDMRGYYREAMSLLTWSVTASREIGDRQGEGAGLGNLGLTHYHLGQLKQANEYYQQALDITRDIGTRRNEGIWLGNLGNVYYSLGQMEKAIEYYNQALEIAQEIGDRENEGTWLGCLGLPHQDLGQVEKAIECYSQALEIAQEIGDRESEGDWLGNLGRGYIALGQAEKAIRYYHQALQIIRETGSRWNEGNQLSNLGGAYVALGQLEKAIEYHQQALDIARETGARRAEGVGLGNLGLAHYRLGQMKQAIEYYSQALEIAQEIGDQWREGDFLGNLGNAYQSLGRIEKAIEHYLQALTISREIGNRRGEGIDLGNLGSAYANLGEMEKAIEYYQQALEIARESGGRENEGTWLGCLGGAYRKVGDTARARQYLSQALAIFEEIKSPYAEQARRQLAELD
jgi:tetratricopeptide (TPR) repeat protein